jgi:hypothetical protein
VSEEASAGLPLPLTGVSSAEESETEAEAPHHHLTRRNDRLLLGAVAAYAVLLSCLMIARGISVTPDVVVVAFGLAALLIGRGKLFLRDWIPFLALFFAYELMRGYADKFGLPVHVADVVSAERFVSFGHIPTAFLQQLLHQGPATAPDGLATLSVVFYFLHFPLPLAVGFLLWLHQRRTYYDFVGALILLSMAGFVTYLLLPVAPPWFAADPVRSEPYCGGACVEGVMHLRNTGYDGLASLFGIKDYLYSYNVYSIGSNDVAAFPSLHAGYPFLAFLFARRAFGRAGWLMLAYTACVWFAIVYLGEHWVVDIIGGVVYALAAYAAILHGPRWARRLMEKVADEEIEASVEAEDAGDAGALRRIGRRVRWTLVVQGAAVAVVGAALALGMSTQGWLGGSSSPLYLLAWLGILGGLWRGAAGLLSR